MKSLRKRQKLPSFLVKVLYVRNLSSKTTEEQLLVVFSMGGALRIDRVKKLRDFAFIHYCQREDAETALERFDGIILDGCIIEVTWAKPPEAQKQKMLMERNAGMYLYKPNYDNLDNTFDLNMHLNAPLSSFPLFSRTSPRQRIQMSNLTNAPITVTRPIQLLGYLCAENSWGNPIFQTSRIDSDPSEICYICWVIIPNMPTQPRRFMSDKVCRSSEEAKHYAACYVLKKLGFIDTEHPFTGSPHSYSLPNSLSGLTKSYLSPTTPVGLSKPVPSTLGFCTPSKNVSFPSIKSPIPSPHPYLFERGQGDVGGFMSNPPPMNAFNSDETENCPPLLDPQAPFEPNSILGLLSQLAIASNVDLPLFNNKPKL